MTIHSPGLRLGLLDALVGGDTGADEGRGLLGVEAGRYVGDVVRIGDEILGKAAILSVAAELRLGADRLPGRQAMLAMTAGRVEPWHADAVALFDDRDAGADRGDAADGLMTRNERQLGLQRPVAGRGMKVGVAHAAGLGLDQDLARAGRRDIDLHAHQRLAELLDERSLHLLGHGSFLLLVCASNLLTRCDRSGGGFRAQPAHGLDHLRQHGRGVAVDHVAVVARRTAH